jgi:HEAT repeat protein
MLACVLSNLAEDVARLLVAGAAAAADHPRLRRHAEALRAAARKVPALTPLADSLALVLSAPPGQAASPLLDLVVRTRQALVAISGAGVSGELEPLPPSGPWRSETPAGTVAAVAQALGSRAKGRVGPVTTALKHGPLADLRLLDALLAALNDSYAELADLVAERVLPAFGTAIRSLLRDGFRVKGKASDGRRLIALAGADPAASAELCREAWRSGSPPVRVAALRALVQVTPAEAEELALAALEGKSPSAVRRAAVKALADLGSRSGRAVTVLARALGDSDFGLRWQSRPLLARCGRAAVPALTDLLASPDAEQRRQAVWILGDIGPEAVEAVPALIARLADPDQYIPWNAAASLGRIGPAAQAAVPGLVALRDGFPSPRGRVAAALALWHISGNASLALPTLIAALSSEEIHARRDAAEALGELGVAARGAVPELVRTLQERGGFVRHFAAKALGQMGLGAEEVVPLLIPMVSEREWHIRHSAIQALGLFGPQAAAALPALEAAAAERAVNIQEAVTAAIAAIRAEARPS